MHRDCVCGLMRTDLQLETHTHVCAHTHAPLRMLDHSWLTVAACSPTACAYWCLLSHTHTHTHTRTHTHTCTTLQAGVDQSAAGSSSMFFHRLRLLVPPFPLEFINWPSYLARQKVWLLSQCKPSKPGASVAFATHATLSLLIRHSFWGSVCSFVRKGLCPPSSTELYFRAGWTA
eukprot:1140702-Pelagomonas_calceolata.AAC.3